MLYYDGAIDLETLESLPDDITASGGRRLKSVRLAPEVLPLLLKNGDVRVVSSIPEDAKGVIWGLSHDRRTILLVLESESFEPVPIGEMPPEIENCEIVLSRLEDGVIYHDTD